MYLSLSKPARTLNSMAKTYLNLLGYQGEQLVACARLLGKGISYPSVSIGRVASAMQCRGDGVGHQLLEQAIHQCETLWPNCEIEIGAQQHLHDFYVKHGFVKTSDMYLEDDIPHIDMKRANRG